MIGRRGHVVRELANVFVDAFDPKINPDIC